MWIILALLLLLWVSCKSRSYFNAKPTAKEVEMYTQQVEKHSGLIGKSLDSAKAKMPWMDAVTYEDLRHLADKGKLTKDAIKQTLL